ncbi:hypothetical protein VTK73DRAFT_3962 [Phialemonium thermophilum]|uniref:Zn(2)-C6 fungal-type domain-containing protein n=1 Tax=Phialemonium thermophilum TaxID=223376 RepID=A0ABR3Y0C1_9PEZI
MPSAKDLPGYVHVFRADIRVRQPGNGAGNGASGVEALSGANHSSRVQRRSRLPVSCSSCRTRKLRCDRHHPACGACVKRGDVDACQYGSVLTASGTRSTIGPTGVPAPSENTGDLIASPGAVAGSAPKNEIRLRLQKLEEMVYQFVSSQATGGRATASTATASAIAIGAETPQSMSLDGRSPQNASDNPPSMKAAVEDEEVPLPALESAVPLDGTGGHLSKEGVETSFVGATHWAAILEGIHDLQDYVETEPESVLGAYQPHLASPGSGTIGDEVDLLFGSPENISLDDVMAALPPRRNVDQLLFQFFRDRLNVPLIVHSGHFRRRYEAFWEDPSSTSFLWISIFFSVLAAATGSDIDDRSRGPEISQQKKFYLAKARQCLIAGEYLKAKPLSVEALAIYGLGSIYGTEATDSFLWSLFGVAVRIGQRMGYHRDPAKLYLGAGVSQPRISAFEAEMRRRTWFIVESFDLLFSLRLGMPTIIHEEETDVGPPTNLADEDFDEDSPCLPPPRLPTELTAALYASVKSRLVRLLRLVQRHALSVRAPDYAHTLAIHYELIAARDAMPAVLRVDAPLRDASFAEPSVSIAHRITLELMFLQARCLLHRRYLTAPRAAADGEDPYALSRRDCRASAARVLDLFAEVEEEVQPGGRLWNAGRFLMGLGLYSYLVAAMVLCLDLSESDDLTPAERQAQLRRLQRAYNSWRKNEHVSRPSDTAHAVRILGAMLRKVSTASSRDQHNHQQTSRPHTNISSTPDQDQQQREQQKSSISSFPTTRLAPSTAARAPSELPGVSEPLYAHSEIGTSATAAATAATPFPYSGVLGPLVDIDFSDMPAPTGEGDIGIADIGFEPMDLEGLDSAFSNPTNIDWNLVDTLLRNGTNSETPLINPTMAFHES